MATTDAAKKLLNDRITQLLAAKNLAIEKRDRLQLASMEAAEFARTLDVEIMGLVKAVNAITAAENHA